MRDVDDFIIETLNETLVRLGLEKWKLRLLLKRYRNCFTFKEEKEIEQIFEQIARIEASITKIVAERFGEE